MRSIWLACLLLLSSCSDLDAVKEQSLKEVKLAKPDEDILSNLEHYEFLHDFVRDNLRQLLTDQKRNHQGVSPHGDHVFEKVDDSAILCYSFNPLTQQEDSEKTAENQLMMELKKRVILMGEAAPKRIEICSDGNVLFTIKMVEDFENFRDFYLEHILIWNVEARKSNRYWNDAFKNQKLNENVTYRIGSVYTG